MAIDCDPEQLERLFSWLSCAKPQEPNREPFSAFASSIIRSGDGLYDLDAPLSLGFKITSRCNLLCDHCWAYPASSVPEPDLDSLLRVMSEADELGVLRIILTGGEPLIRDDIVDLVRFLKERHFVVEIFTNGTAATLQNLVEVLPYLSPQTDMIQLSVDGPDTDVISAQRPGMKSRDFASLGDVIQLTRQHDITLRANMTVTQHNISVVDRTFLFVSGLGASLFRVSPYVPLGRAEKYNSHQDWYVNAYVDGVTRCLDLSKSSKTLFDFGLPMRAFSIAAQDAGEAYSASTPFRLFSGGVSLEILPDGEAYPSAASIYSSSLRLGNVFDEGLHSVWMKSVPRLAQKGRDLSRTKCGACRLLGVCHGGSEERAFDAYGTFHAPDPTCTYDAPDELQNTTH